MFSVKWRQAGTSSMHGLELKPPPLPHGCTVAPVPGRTPVGLIIMTGDLRPRLRFTLRLQHFVTLGLRPSKILSARTQVHGQGAEWCILQDTCTGDHACKSVSFCGGVHRSSSSALLLIIILLFIFSTTFSYTVVTSYCLFIVKILCGMEIGRFWELSWRLTEKMKQDLLMSFKVLQAKKIDAVHWNVN